MAATQDDAAYKPKAEEEEFSQEAADQKADETVARPAAAVDECSDDEEDPVIRTLNQMSRRNMMTPEWIENRKKEHYAYIAFYNRICRACDDLDSEEDDDGDDDAEGLCASVDLSGLNTVGGESHVMDAVGMHVHPQADKENAVAAAAAAEESSS